MEEGTFAAWLKRDGDRVQAGELLFCLESEKATQDIEAIDSGFLHLPPEAPKPGDPVKVGQLLAYLLAEGEVLATTANTPSPGAQEPSSPSGSAEALGAQLADAAAAAAIVGPIATPRARRVSRELGVDWAMLEGSGAGGRIREADVRRAALSSLEGSQPPAGPVPVPGIGMTVMRRVIAERMRTSARNTVPVTLHTLVDASRLVRLREEWKRAGRRKLPSYTDILLVLTARALVVHPSLNACWEGDGLNLSHTVHIGIAVDTEAGLTVPVLRNAGVLSLEQVAERTRDLIERTRARKAAAEELRGGTFTLTNLGAYGVDAFTPVINYPQVAILGMGRIRKQLVVEGEALVIRDMMSLSLTFDHQALDGAPAARFLQALTELIQTAEGLA